MELKILMVVYPKIGGSQYFRQIHPHEPIMNDVDFEVDIINDFTYVPNEVFQKYQIVLFHKNYVTPDVLIRLKVLGIKTMVDFDDYWYLPYNHLSYQYYKANDQSEKYIEIIKQSDFISATTEILAHEVRKFNPNVFMFPNSISNSHPNLKQIEIPSKNLRFGYIGGAYHLPDIELLRGLNNSLSNSGMGYTLNLFGYKHDSVYYDYASILTNNGQYTNNLNLYQTLPVPEYLYFYNMIDVSLVPLIPNKFNSMKSELKLIEAGAFNRPVIASNVLPYKPYLKHKKNAFIAENKTDWYKGIKFFIKNPKAVFDYGLQLQNDIQKQFNYERITQCRAEIYKWIIQKG